MELLSQQSPPISNKEDRSEGASITSACGMAKYAPLVASSLGVGGTIRAGESVNGRVEAIPIGTNNAIEVVIRVDEDKQRDYLERPVRANDCNITSLTHI